MNKITSWADPHHKINITFRIYNKYEVWNQDVKMNKSTSWLPLQHISHWHESVAAVPPILLYKIIKFQITTLKLTNLSPDCIPIRETGTISINRHPSNTSLYYTKISSFKSRPKNEQTHHLIVSTSAKPKTFQKIRLHPILQYNIYQK